MARVNRDEKWLEDYNARRAAGGRSPDSTTKLNRAPRATSPQKRGPEVKARKPPNRTEAEYESLYLRPRLQARELLDYKFSSIALVLGFDWRYYPDYFALPASGRPQVHEVKGGYKREDAVKSFKAAVEQFGAYFDFFLCEKLDSGEWRITKFE